MPGCRACGAEDELFESPGRDICRKCLSKMARADARTELFIGRSWRKNFTQGRDRLRERLTDGFNAFRDDEDDR